MAYKLKRNTKPATNEIAKRRRKKQEIVREMIRVGVFSERCVCGRCEKGDYSSLCTSYGNIAKLANQIGLPTTTGRKGKWQTTQVARLFPESKHKNKINRVGAETTPNNEVTKLF